MKANRKFKEEENAVSAVIGVILMVAITVAIAATVYVYVAGFGSETSAPENATFTARILGGNLKITYSNGDEDIATSDITIVIDTGYALVLGTNGTSGDLSSDGNWDPGDYVTNPVTDIDNDPCMVSVVVKGTTVLDTEVNL